MAFVWERVSDEEKDFYNSLGIRDWSGKRTRSFIPKYTDWCIDRERNAILIELGGGRDSDPIFWAFLCNNSEIRIETASKLTKTANNKMLREITKIVMSKNSFKQKDEMISLILEAFSALSESSGGMLITEIHCVPKLED